MTFSTPGLSYDDILGFAAETGYDGIEIRIVAKHAHGIETDLSAADRAEAKRKAVDAGVDIACVATSCKYADPQTVDENIEATHAAIDLAADLGAPTIRVFGGQLGEGIDRETAITNVASALASVADHAGERGVSVCMETHDDWCDPAHVALVMKQVDRPAIRVNWDVLHPVRTDLATVDQSYQLLEPWITHVHVHDYDEKPMGNLVPIGTGFVDHRRAIELLVKMGYRGYVSGEWINWSDPYTTHLPRELATLKGYDEALG